MQKDITRQENHCEPRANEKSRNRNAKLAILHAAKFIWNFKADFWNLVISSRVLWIFESVPGGNGASRRPGKRREKMGAVARAKGLETTYCQFKLSSDSGWNLVLLRYATTLRRTSFCVSKGIQFCSTCFNKWIRS